MEKLNSGLGVWMLILVMGISISSCKQDTKEQQQGDRDQQMQTETEQNTERIYRAQISSVNKSANKNRNVQGNVILEIQGSQLLINVEASGLEPNMMYLQHLHGSKEAGEINCPLPTADTNNDGVVDITEAYEVAGVTMIPLHDDPTSMEIKTETYPTADEDGNILYQQTVDLTELRDSFMEKFDWEELDFSKFTYLIHGVEEDAVPKSAESVKDLPAHVTLPVGCAKLSQ